MTQPVLETRQRFLNQDGTFNVVKPKEIHRSTLAETIFSYSWKKFIGAVFLAYIVINFIFAFLFWIVPGSIKNGEFDSFVDALFFSVQTLSTIGYGVMSPSGLYANILVAIEVVTGMVVFAILTGLVFAKFARPRARVIFSKHAVIRDFEGMPVLQFRVANLRRAEIVNAEARVMLLEDIVLANGENFTKITNMPLRRSSTQIFSLSWILMHELNETSPLKDWAPDSKRNFEIIVTITGLDEITGSLLQVRHSIIETEIFPQHRFADIIQDLPDGRAKLSLETIHNVLPI